MAIATLRECADCHKKMSSDMFHQTKNGRDGLHSYCKPCRAGRASRRYFSNVDHYRKKQRVAGDKYRASRRVYRRKAYTLKRFGLEPGIVDAFVTSYVELNGPNCSCCGMECEVVGGIKKPGMRRLVLDHNHNTGQLRSMICDFCNTALGKLGDTSTGVRKLLAYIQRFEQ